MKNGGKHKQKDSFVEALSADVQYAVLTKPGRIQILVRPSTKQLRRRGQRGWHLFGTVVDSADPRGSLAATVEQALVQTEANGKPAEA